MYHIMVHKQADESEESGYFYSISLRRVDDKPGKIQFEFNDDWLQEHFGKKGAVLEEDSRFFDVLAESVDLNLNGRLTIKMQGLKRKLAEHKRIILH